jgi:hypothetical protein
MYFMQRHGGQQRCNMLFVPENSAFKNLYSVIACAFWWTSAGADDGDGKLVLETPTMAFRCFDWVGARADTLDNWEWRDRAF